MKLPAGVEVCVGGHNYVGEIPDAIAAGCGYVTEEPVAPAPAPSKKKWTNEPA